MGTNIHGSIEIRGVYRHPEMEHLWVYFADLGIAYSRNLWMYQKLFDVRNEEYTRTPLFAGRGLPNDITDETRMNHAITEREQKSGRTHDDSWFTWDELLSLPSEDIVEVSSVTDRNWTAVFGVCGELSKTYGAENVRLVVWFEG